MSYPQGMKATEAPALANSKLPSIVDSQQRDTALNPAYSCIVQAPAGSGKTELLTQRFLTMLARVDDPEELLAITFTRKSAAEMRNRIIGAIFPANENPTGLAATRALAEAVRQRDAEKNWQLRSHPARLRIRTIDSVNAWLSATAPLLETSAGGQVSEAPWDLYSSAAQRTAEMICTDDENGMAVQNLLTHLDNRYETFIRLLTRMLARRDQWLDFVVDIRTANEPSNAVRQELEACLYDLVAAELESAAAHLDTQQRTEIVELLRFAGVNLSDNNPDSLWRHWLETDAFPLPVPEQLALWKLIAEFLLTKNKNAAFRKRLDKNAGFPAGAGENKARKESAQALINDIMEQGTPPEVFGALRLLPAPKYTDTQWDMLQSLLRVLQLAAAQLNIVFAEQAETDYPAVAKAAIEALSGNDAPTNLALRLDYRISHILIDEFQDTSSAQLKLLSTLTAGWQDGDGRTVFIVGDPMQSIYRFRQAEVGLFLELQRDGLPNVQLKPITLQSNFRSDPAVVDWVNMVFSQIMPAKSDMTRGAVGYAPGSAVKAANADAGVTLHPLALPSRSDEAEQVATTVKETLQRWPDQTIGILVRSRAHARALVEKLREREIYFSGSGLENTIETQTIQDLLCLTRALSHLADRTAWLGVLRAPWCGLTLTDLETLAGPDRHTGIWTLLNNPGIFAALSDDGQKRAAQLRNVLRPVFERRGSLSLRDLVEGVWLQLGGPGFLLDDVDMQRAQTYFAALDRVDVGGDCADSFNLHEQIAEQLKTEDIDAAVNILTIHKAKGLEFDTVILPALEAGIRGDDKPVLAWQEIIRPNGQPGLIIAPVEAVGEEGDLLFELARRQNKLRSNYESDRLLYVAATRARERLHLYYGLHTDVDSDKSPRSPVAGSLLSRLWPAIEDQHSEFDALPGTEAKQDGWLKPTLKRYDLNWHIPDAPKALQAPDTNPARVETRAVTYDWASTTAMQIGTVTHRWLQFLVENNCANWTRTELEQHVPTYQLMLRELGVASDEIESASQTILQSLCKAIAHDKGRWLMFDNHDDSHCEFGLTALLNERMEQVIVDRSFVDSNNDRWIVDYKTSSHSGGDLDGFIASEVERYSEQLERYKHVYQLLEPQRACRVALYFPLLDVFQEVELP